ncbi:MAG: protein kinase [Planctomycetes bacterium]|nr:protein kinase [Planctomycetota bacterium]
MPVEALCPNPSCAKRYSIPDASAGRPVRCRACGQAFVTGGQTVISPKLAPSVGATSTTVIAIGQSLGRFVIREELGAGAFGTVYRAFDPVLNREVALKVLKAEVAADARRVQRFLREAKAAAGLHHPHIVAVFDAGQDGGRYYIASAFIAGRPLADAIPDGGAKFARAAKLVRELAEALAYAHEQGVVHRDVKPANVMLDAQGRVHLMDFGLAAKSDGESKLTTDGAVMGTPAYMSPEQAAGQTGEAQPATDQYAVGVVLYELLTGQVPFTGPLPVVIHNVIRTDPEPPRHHRADVPVDLETICLKAMSKRPGDRYAGCQDLADDLRRWLEGEPVSARPLPRWERAVRWVRKNPALASAGVLGAVVTVLGLITASVVPLWFRAESAKKDAIQQREEADARRAEAVQQRGIAEEAQRDANTQRGVALAARDKIAALNAQLERFNYGRTIQVAYQAWRDNNVVATRGLLDGTPPHLRGWEWNYVNRICDSSLLTLGGHKAPLYSAAFSPDGTRIVTGSWDHTAKVWDAKTGNELLTLGGHKAPLFSAAFSADGSRIVTASGDGTAKVWDAKTGTELLTLKGHRDGVLSVAISADGTRIVTASADRTAKVWEVPAAKPEGFAKTGTELLTLRGHTDIVFSAAISADGTRIVTGSWDHTAKVWDAKTGNELLTLKGHTGQVHSVAISADGARIATGSFDQTAKIWEVLSAKPEGFAKTGTELLTLKGHMGSVTSVSFSTDGTRIATGSTDRQVKVWEVPSAKPEGFAKTGSELFTLKGHTDGVYAASFSPDRTQIVTASFDLTAKVWEVPSAKSAGFAKTDTESLEFGERAVVASPAAHALLIFCPVVFSPDGTRIVTADNTAEARVWDAKTGTELLALKGHVGAVVSASFSTDGTRIATASADQTAKIWDAKTGTELLTLRGHKAPLYSAAFSPDGSRIVTASSDQTAKVWEVPSAKPEGAAKTGTELLTLRGHTDIVYSAAFSPDGSRIVTASNDGTAKVWEVPSAKSAGAAKTGADIHTLKGHDRYVRSAAFSPDGSRIVTSSYRTVKVWDAKTGVEILAFKGHTGHVNSAAFSPDGSRIVTAGDDGTAKLLDAKTGVEVLSLQAHRTTEHSASFSPDGSRIVTRGRSGLSESVKVFDARPFGK